MGFNDDEISTVLRHFRPKPGFVPVNDISHGVGVSIGKRKIRRERTFSNVKYASEEGGKLRLSYIHDSNVLLKFEVRIRPLGVSCILCSGPPCYPSDVMNKLQQGVKKICSDLSAPSNKCSLFYFLSMLLKTLNRDLPPMNCADCLGAKEDWEKLAWRLASNASSPIGTVQRVMDVMILLVRAAAAGRNRAKLCSPVPPDFVCGDADVIANNVFNTTDCISGINLSGRWHSRSVSEQHSAPDLLAFLLSLPWVDGGIITTKDTTTGRTRSATASASANLCLNVDKALGDETPVFKSLAKERGLVTAYHGTKIENAWSILNYGLQNLSNHGTLSQNGAIMGDGVYLSNSYGVAAFFAQSAAQQSRALTLAWLHPSLRRLLLFSDDVQLSNLAPLQDYNISCLPVFEASIIAPPESILGGTASDKGCTRREGKYFVVPNSDHIRITKLHLTLGISKKRKMWPSFSLCYISLFFIFIWIATSFLGGNAEGLGRLSKRGIRAHFNSFY